MPLGVANPDSRTAKAREAKLEKAAVRAIDDPVTLARAARIVRAALARQRLTLDEIQPAASARADAA